MNAVLDIIVTFFTKNAFVASFIVVGVLCLVSDFVSKKITKGRIHSSAIAIFLGLILAYISGVVMNSGLAPEEGVKYTKGLADVAMFTGVGFLGSSMLRDFTIVSTSFGAKVSEVKKGGVVAVIALLVGIVASFTVGGIVAYAFGFTDAKDVATIGAGAVTFVVGPVTGEALGASAEAVTLSIAAGVVKSVAVMLVTPVVAKKVGLTTPRAAMIFGGLMGTTSGTTAGLAATDPKLVPYGAMTSTFYTGLGCLLCPSVLYALTELIL